MESATTHHLQDQLVSSSSPSSCFGHPFTPPFFETKQQENTAVSSQLYSCSSMAPDAYNYWPNINNASTNHQDVGDGEQYYRRHTDILSSTEDKLLLKSFSYINKIPTTDLYASHHTAANAQILPSFHVSSFNPTAVPVTTTASLPMDFEALDRLASSRFSPIFKHGFSNYALHQPPFYASNKVSSASSNAVVEAKRNSDDIQNAPKKSRLEARSSCPPFKVRKEKLGDRIAALQQLVAPFGKTDTASVLMEAIGYIKFLQTQVETLSVPYMKASRNKPNRVAKGAANENEYEESKLDLKSRGLCLVPLSCLSYITDGGGAAVWPPPHFRGAT